MAWGGKRMMDMASDFMKTIKTIEEKINTYAGLLPAQDLQNFKNLAHNLGEALKEEENKGKILRLGIIGSVKAGKSTFLNALLFDGEEILPKAATPMTASLTRLRYSEKQYARFVYYSHEDWRLIEDAYREVENELAIKVREAQRREDAIARNDPAYIPRVIDRAAILRGLDLSESLRACHELVEQARENGLDIYDMLGDEHRENIDSPGRAATLMREYVSSSGKYSPLVKYVELGLDNRTLKDMEIVDTPGLNDPVRSRSEETYKFMCQCDAVFLLSRASQFLTNEDMDLLRRRLVDNGIGQVTVIATQLDLGAQNERGKTGSYKEAIRRTLQSITRTARKYGIPEMPVPVSSIFEIIALKMEKNLPLNSEERHIERNVSFFTEDAPSDAELFHEYSNIKGVREELQKYRKEKDRIIAEHQQARARESKRNFIEILDAMIKAMDTQSRILQDYDMVSLKKLSAGLMEVMDNINIPVSNIFAGMESEAGQKFADLKQRLLANASSFEDIYVESKTHQEEKSHVTGHLWWKKTHYTVYNVTTYTAQLAEALQQLRAYAAKCEEEINNTIKELFDKNAIRVRLKQVVLPLFRKCEQENVTLALNEDMILLPVDALIQKFVIPEWKFDNTPYNAALQKQFGDQIENEKITTFKTAYELQLQELYKAVRKSLEAKVKEISEQLVNASVHFAGDVRARLEEQTGSIMEQMKNKEESLKKYTICRQCLEQCKKMVVE